MQGNFIKIAIVLGIVFIFWFFSSREYDTVEDYIAAMKKVQEKTTGYTFEIQESTKNKDRYYKAYVKGNKWMVEVSENSGKTYTNKVYFDGEQMYAYNSEQNIYMVHPIMHLLRNANEKDKSYLFSISNPVEPLIHWYAPFGIKDKVEMSFINQHDTKNKLACRMIQYDKFVKFCVNDMYGVAIYADVDTEKTDIVLNVTSIDDADISDEQLKIPSNARFVDSAALLYALGQMYR